MTEKINTPDNKFVVCVFIAGVILLALLVGNAIGIAVSASYYDIAGFGDFYDAMGGWEAVARLVISLVLIVYSVQQMKKLKRYLY
ncbi:MAG: hypothetical protein FWC73_05865 [Defluviitaleaceae bacterium]|nr:hypothetical protein [Defluviitaleaceae bacterium]